MTQPASGPPVVPRPAGQPGAVPREPSAGLSGEVALGRLLARVEAAPPASAVDVLAADLAERVEAREVRFLITDYSAESLVPLASTVAGTTSRLPDRVLLDEDSVQARALRTQQPQQVPSTDDDADCLVVPVTARGDAIGVLEVVLDGPPDEATTEYVRAAAHAFAYVVAAERRYTDLYEWGQRTAPLSLAAEIQHRLLPASYTCEAGTFTLSGWLEPAGQVGGDTFDYSLDHERLHLSLTDAMGHEVEAAMLATLAVGGLRNSRRIGASVASMAGAASRAIAALGGVGRFVTGQIVSVDLATGVADVVNAGHPAPLRLRAGRVGPVELEVDPPLGVVAEHLYRLQRLVLEPGDRLVLLTDGMLENHDGSVDLAAIVAGTAALHPREAVHTMSRAVRAAAGGTLRDDATVLVLDWYGGDTGRRRGASAGAETGLASR